MNMTMTNSMTKSMTNDHYHVMEIRDHDYENYVEN